MTNLDFTVIQMIVDRSGSMDAIKDDAQGSLNEFIKEQKKNPGKCSLSITQFDQEIETVQELVDIKKVKKYTLSPRGGTALNDAMGKTIDELGVVLAGMEESERPGTVFVVVITDGYENSSKVFTSAMVKERVERQTNDYGWQFIFLAANQDAVLTGADYGFAPERSATYTASSAGVKGMAGMVTNSVTRSRIGGQSVSFTEEDRDKAMGK